MEGRKIVRISICGGEGYLDKVQQITKVLTKDLNLQSDQIEFQRGGFRELKVEVIEAGAAQTVISRNGPGFFTNSTPIEILTFISPFF